MEERKTLRLAGRQNSVPDNFGGYLPPQAPEFEEYILGAVMLESKSFDLIPFLKPQHFYIEAHREVFNAILQLRSLNQPHDFRLVIQQLKKSGKLESVGGAVFVMQLTAKVSNGGHIQTHARVVLEQAIKRELITIASDIQRQAYDDTSDALELLDRKLELLEFLKTRETAAEGPEIIKAQWEQLRIMNKPDRPETLIKLGDADVCTVGNISLLVGKKKSRKSLLVAYLLYLFLKSRQNLADNILVFDTEQEEYDVWAAKDRIFRMTNQHIPIFCLRGLSPRERREFIELTLKYWEQSTGHKVIIMVIDGIRDCMSNINDPDESTEVMSWLMRMNVQYRVHIMSVLHLNKTDGNARGHIGSELLNKAEVTIEVTLDPTSKDLYPPSVVKCESSRRKPFEPFMFTHSEEGIPELLGAQIGNNSVDTDNQVKLLEKCFEGQNLRHPDLKEQIRTYFEVGDTKAKQLIVKFVAKGWIMKSGKDRSPNLTYKLLASAGQYMPPPVIEDDPQSLIPYSDIPLPSESDNIDLPF